MDWLPAMSWLRQKLQWFGFDSTRYFEPAHGYPQAKTLAAHVLLKKGTLIANELDTIPLDSDLAPTIWEFMPHNATPGSGSRNQALAKSIALEVSMTDPVSIIIASSPSEKSTITLKNDKLTGIRSIEIKNRELEEIFVPDGFEFERPMVDLDFRYMYKHAAGYDPKLLDYPLPYLLKGGGGGNEVGTCGGNRFSGFSKTLKDNVESW
jgi:hypothetical protein